MPPGTMGDVTAKSSSTMPFATSANGHPMPRRTSPENSVTLRHHRLARDTLLRPELASQHDHPTSPRRNSSNESHVTRQSDPKCWFDRSNRNAPAAFDQTSMDIDPPFYQKLSDSSNEEHNPARSSAYPFTPSAYNSTLKPPLPAHSSSADDYRSVIDDLTVENKRLKEELKRYKSGPDPLRKDKLFEIKFHGLPHKKKVELEAALRDFASSLEGSTTSSSERKKPSKHVNRVQGSSLNSKPDSASSSNSRPLDSAYASMSAGPSSISHHASMSSLGRPTLQRTKSSADQIVETYLREIPQGLMPRIVSLTDHEKKKIVVRRLEQLFTGRFGGKGRKIQPELSVGYGGANPVLNPSGVPAPALPNDDPREARIQLNLPSDHANSREEVSTSNSNGENEAQENRTGSGSASNEHSGSGNSPQNEAGPEQRATRLLDLDPDRTQIPSENMEYIRHLGAMAPEYLPEARYKSSDASMDADGWIHLNLLCNLAQLHILNVTPDYIRSAVSERSAKFQLSRDGRKIRWRGGTHGTKFSSDSSGDSSERSPDALAADGSNEDGQRKRSRTSSQVSPGGAKLHAPVSTGGFHYKPMFLHQSSSAGTSLDESDSQASYHVDYSNIKTRSTGFASRSGSSPRKKRRRDGAVIYYTGAPFCLDLSGDPGNDALADSLPVPDSSQEHLDSSEGHPSLTRTASGSTLPFRPLVDRLHEMDLEGGADAEYVTEESDMYDTDDFGFCWCEQPEKTELNPLQVSLEPCGLGGVTPEDHFAVLVVTRHPILSPFRLRRAQVCANMGDVVEVITKRKAGLTGSSLGKPYDIAQCQVLQQRYKELKPLPLPPPGIFYPPFTETTDSEADSGFEDDYDYGDDISDAVTSDSESASQRANPHQSDILGMAEADESNEDDLFDGNRLRSIPKVSFAPPHIVSQDSGRHPSGEFSRVYSVQPDSSAATAGEASGYSSGREDD